MPASSSPPRPLPRGSPDPPRNDRAGPCSGRRAGRPSNALATTWSRWSGRRRAARVDASSRSSSPSRPWPSGPCFGTPPSGPGWTGPDRTPAAGSARFDLVTSWISTWRPVSRYRSRPSTRLLARLRMPTSRPRPRSPMEPTTPPEGPMELGRTGAAACPHGFGTPAGRPGGRGPRSRILRSTLACRTSHA